MSYSRIRLPVDNSRPVIKTRPRVRFKRQELDSDDEEDSRTEKDSIEDEADKDSNMNWILGGVAALILFAVSGKSQESNTPRFERIHY